jgi:Fic family protein
MSTWDVTFRTKYDTENKEILSTLAKCYAIASVISDIPITPKRQYKLDRLNILRAVRGTTGIEGADLTEDEVRRIMETPKTKPVLPANRQREEQEVRCAEILMQYVVRLVNGDPGCALNEKLVSTFHRTLTNNIIYENNTPGEYRTYPVKAGDYTPPQWNHVKGLMEGFFSWFNKGEPKKWDPIIRAMVAHFYIVSIHPFGAGNGRTARAVESFLLYKAGINARGFYSLANYYYQHRSEYIHFLNVVRFQTENDLTLFVLFALRGLASELKGVHQEVLLEVREIAFRDYVHDALSDKLGSKPGARMFNFMLGLGSETLSVKALREGEHSIGRLYHGLTPKTFSRDITELKNLQLIMVQDGQVKANLDLMGKFPAYNEIVRQSKDNELLPELP